GVAEALFFSQSTVLNQIASEYKVSVSVPRFDSSKDAVSVAFEITECIEQLCEKMKGNGKKEDVRSNQIIEYIEQRYTDSSFYMPELVGKFELSDRAIVQILKKATGDNFSNYVGKLRISKARDLLSSTNMPVSDVAGASGFDSSNSLYKAFKKVYGVSPSVYRESRKNEKEQVL
ncbi:MAG: AraC family transcriptional regulator, partial [Clostridia bacterium]|nr:AraC family transcriptional regulator [Clostridia bacterium]